MAKTRFKQRFSDSKAYAVHYFSCTIAFFVIFSTLPQNYRCKHFQVIHSVRATILLHTSVSTLWAIVFNMYVQTSLQNSKFIAYNHMNNKNHDISGAHHIETMGIRLVHLFSSRLRLANLGWAILHILLILPLRK